MRRNEYFNNKLIPKTLLRFIYFPLCVLSSSSLISSTSSLILSSLLTLAAGTPGRPRTAAAGAGIHFQSRQNPMLDTRTLTPAGRPALWQLPAIHQQHSDILLEHGSQVLLLRVGRKRATPSGLAVRLSTWPVPFAR
jgi:hypothetical protein